MKTLNILVTSLIVAVITSCNPVTENINLVGTWGVKYIKQDQKILVDEKDELVFSFSSDSSLK